MPIYEGEEDLEFADRSPGSLKQQPQSVQQSPSPLERNPSRFSAKMKLREISHNIQSPDPLSSPLAKTLKGRKKSKIDLRKTSFEASQYIDHLESQLQSTQESLVSPSTGIPLKDKVKYLQAQNQQLYVQLEEWEEYFDTRVKEAVEHINTHELELQRKIKTLEDNLLSKEALIRDLEYRDRDRNRHDQLGLENLKIANEKIEREKQNLEDTNKSLERRNDVLTELLAQSPTRAHHVDDPLTSPTREMFRRTPRPRSMMARTPSNSDHNSRSRPLSLGTTPPLLDRPQEYFTSRAIGCPTAPNSASEPSKQGLSIHAYDSGLGDSYSVQSMGGTASQRNSIMSNSSSSPAAWGLPLPVSPTGSRSDRPTKSRKLRRFASGSTSLKPLVLPAIMGTHSHSLSTSTSSRSIASPTREYSTDSLDPTTAFLSRDSYETPTQPRRNLPGRTTSWAAEDALMALEGKTPEHFDSFEAVLAQNDEPLPNDAEDILHRNVAPQDLMRDFNLARASPSALSQSFIYARPDQDSYTTLGEELAKVNYHGLPSLNGNDIGDLDISPTESPGLPSLKTFDPCLNMDAFSIPYNPSINPGFPRSMPQFTPIQQQHLLQNIDSPLNFPQPQSRVFSSSTNTSAGSNQSRKRRWSLRNSRGNFDSFKDLTFLTPTPKQNRPVHAWPKVQLRRKVVHKRGQSSSVNKRQPKSWRAPNVMNLKSKPSLTSISKSTVLGTFAKYSNYLTRLRTDPTSIARRVIANAWKTNWGKLGTFSWWVLGLFFGARRPTSQVGVVSDIEASARRKWDVAFGGIEGLDSLHDGAHQYQVLRPHHGVSPGYDTASPLYEDQRSAYTPNRAMTGGERRLEGEMSPYSRTDRNESRSNTQGRPKPGWSHSLLLWSKFSFALMLAISGAVVEGPEAMLRECESTSEQESRATSPRSMRDARSKHLSEAEETAEYMFTSSFASGVNDDEVPSAAKFAPQSHSVVPLSHENTDPDKVDHALAKIASTTPRVPPPTTRNTIFNRDYSAEMRSREKLEAQRNDMLAADKAISFGTPRREASDVANVLQRPRGSTIARQDFQVSTMSDEDKENQYQGYETDEIGEGPDFYDAGGHSSTDNDYDHDDEYKNVQTIKASRLPQRQSISDVTWWQNMGTNDFDRGRI